MAHLTKVAGSLRMPEVTSWAEQTFVLASELPLGWNRLAIQKNVLVAMSAENPERALELLRGMDIPTAIDEIGGFPEDVRSDAARIILFNYLRQNGHRSFDELFSVAQYLGETGQYPYLALPPLFSSFSSRSDQEKRAQLFAEATRYYKRGSKFTSEDRDFVTLLLAVWNLVPEGAVAEALRAASERLLREQQTENQAFAGQVQTVTGAHSFRTEREQLLWQLMPVIRKVQPTLAARILEKRPTFGNAKLDVIGSEAAVVQGSADNALLGTALEEIRLEHIGRIAQDQPEQALRLAHSLQQPSVRATAFAMIGASTNDLSQAADLAAQAGKAIDSLDPTAEKVKALAWLAAAQARIGNQDQSRQTIQAGLDLGQELFARFVLSRPAAPAYMAEVFDPLLSIASIGVRYHPQFTVAAIRQIRNEVLQAYLLAEGASELSKQDTKRRPLG